MSLHAEVGRAAAGPRAAVAPLLTPIRAQASMSPRAIALKDGHRSLDYTALLDAVARTTSTLRDAGVRDGDIVALSAQRSVDAIVALLAIVACGAAYLPLDLEFPESRLAAMLDDAAPRFAIGSTADRAHFPQALTWIDSHATNAANANFAPGDGELAYVLFTSGSTGRPKGVAMRSAAVANLIDWHRTHPRLGRPARTLQFAPLGFDVSFQEIFSTLATGGSLVLPTDAERRDPYALLALLARERIERLFLPYVGMQALAEAVAAGGDVPRDLRDVITAGEQLRITPAIRALFAQLPGAVLHNHYGPTETHVVTAHELRDAPATWPELPPIGTRLPHVCVCLVDTDLAPVADGDEGELLLGGDCLAAGYIHRPELTAERFVERRGERWYRTGDRARWNRGALEYLGRLDEQIKLDGFRIEPAEIEIVLCRHPMVAEAAVVAEERAGGRRLVAHVVARDAHADEPALASLLGAHCAAELPAWQVPQAFVLHAALPQTASGKIDRRLLAREAERSTLDWRDGAPLREQLLHLWSQLLDVESLDAEANLFEHGARSLTVVRALTELRRHGHVMSAVQVYEHPSVAAQAALFDGRSAVSDPCSAQDERARGNAQRAAFARFARGGAQ